MKRVFISAEAIDSLKKSDLIATQNLSTYNPYYYDLSNNRYIIDVQWFKSLPAFTQDLISQSLGNATIVFSDIQVPHTHSKTFKVNAIYQAYTYSYDYDYWHHRKDVTLLPLSDEEKECLRELTEKRIQDKEPYQETHTALINLRKRIEQATVRRQDYFIRLSGTSSKKDETVIPLRKSRTMMDYLTRSFAFLSQEYCQPKKRTSIILIPWNDKIDARSEFRVFIHDKQVTGIAQQRWSRDFSYTLEEVDIIDASIVKSGFWDALPYSSLVADVFVDFLKKEACLIECNPFGSFGPSESSLFSWSVDRDVLYGKKQGEIRLVSG